MGKCHIKKTSKTSFIYKIRIGMKNRIKAYRDDLLDNKFNEIRTISWPIMGRRNFFPFLKKINPFETYKFLLL